MCKVRFSFSLFLGNILHSENIEQHWKDDNTVDVVLCGTCFCLPCECRIVNIVLSPKICVNADNHKGCNSKHGKKTLKRSRGTYIWRF